MAGRFLMLVSRHDSGPLSIDQGIGCGQNRRRRALVTKDVVAGHCALYN
jgi:hypothetical protein